ncbi:hypothetical protein [Blautia argi]|uniref:hypothetical protein n=1 Tax=Blautia argi TaxID=1912897 RepID=UPI0013A704BE|nr:hypothetical protein [Blautia argi]
MKAKNRKIKSLFLFFVLFLIITSPALLIAVQKSFATRIACVGDSITYGAKIEDRFIHSYPGAPAANAGEPLSGQKFRCQRIYASKKRQLPLLG